MEPGKCLCGYGISERMARERLLPEPLPQHFPDAVLAPPAVLNETTEHFRLLSHTLEFAASLIHQLS